jgi:bisphosphoglycerate-independent phosphoglycerate mutase (AlkP superfamily)
MRPYQRPRQIQNTRVNHGLMMIEKTPSTIAKGRFGKYPTSDNLGNFRIFRAKARRTLKQNLRTSWRNFVSKLNCHTPMDKVWNMVQKIKGKNNKTNIHHLKDGHDTLTSEQDISNKLGQTFSKKNSSTRISKILKRKRKN